jgi:hypothetical protein
MTSARAGESTIGEPSLEAIPGALSDVDRVYVRTEPGATPLAPPRGRGPQPTATVGRRDASGGHATRRVATLRRDETTLVGAPTGMGRRETTSPRPSALDGAGRQLSRQHGLSPEEEREAVADAMRLLREYARDGGWIDD